MAEETKVEKEVTEEVEENKEAEAEVVEEEKVDQEDQIKILQGEVDKWKNDYYKVFADMENIPYAVHGNARYLYRSIPVLFHPIEKILSFEY